MAPLGPPSYIKLSFRAKQSSMRNWPFFKNLAGVAALDMDLVYKSWSHKSFKVMKSQEVKFTNNKFFFTFPNVFWCKDQLLWNIKLILSKVNKHNNTKKWSEIWQVLINKFKSCLPMWDFLMKGDKGSCITILHISY